MSSRLAWFVVALRAPSSAAENRLHLSFHPVLCSSSTSNRALLRTLVRRCCVFVYDCFFLAPSQVFASRGFGEDSIGYNLTQMITALLIILSSLTFLVLLSFEVYRSVKFAAINEVARQVRFILAVCTLCASCWPPARSVGWGWGVDLNLSCLLSPYFSAGGGRDCRGRAKGSFLALRGPAGRCACSSQPSEGHVIPQEPFARGECRLARGPLVWSGTAFA